MKFIQISVQCSSLRMHQSGCFFNCNQNYYYMRTIYMELGDFQLFNMRFYYLSVKPSTLQSRRLMAWGQLNITCWTTADPLTHDPCWTTADPFNKFSLRFHFNLDPRALLRMTTADNIGFHFYFSIMCRSEVKSPKTSTNCKQVF